MDTALLEEHLARLGLRLELAQRERFCRYYRELLAWNRRINLTTIVAWEEVQVQHFFDSLTCLPFLPSQAWGGSYRMVDIGSGAGFPGLPLKIFLPQAGLTLIESVAKKTAFLRHLVEVLELDAVQVLTCRAEEAGRDPAHREVYDLALARAVGGLATLVEYALPLLRLGGFSWPTKGGRWRRRWSRRRRLCVSWAGDWARCIRWSGPAWRPPAIWCSSRKFPPPRSVFPAGRACRPGVRCVENRSHRGDPDVLVYRRPGRTAMNIER